MAGILKQTIIKTFNTLGTFAKGIQEKSLVLVYGAPIEVNIEIDFTDKNSIEEYFKKLPKITQSPSLTTVNRTLKIINTYDVCNPLEGAINIVAQNLMSGAQGKINEVINAFRSTNIVDSPQLREALVPVTFDLKTGEEVISMTFQTTNKVSLVVAFTGDEITNKPNIISRGSYVTLTQTDDPKSKSFYMRGSVDRFFEVNDPLPGIEYIINVDSMGPSSEPPYERDQKGNLIKDSTGQPIPQQFVLWQIESESKLTGDSRELAKELNSLTNTLRELGVSDLISVISTFPNSGNFRKTLQDVEKIINIVALPAENVANVTGTIAQTLDGGLTTEETILRVRILRDFYQKLLPYTNLSFLITNVFKKQVEDINSVLRDAIPYNDLANVVKYVSLQTRNVLGIINVILLGLKVINSIIRTVMVVLKVVKVIIKIIKKLIKFIPATWSTIGSIQTVSSVIKSWEEGVDKALSQLKEASLVVTNLMGALALVRRELLVTLSELAKFARKLESCDKLDSSLSSAMLEANRNTFWALKNLIEGAPQAENIGVRSKKGEEALESGYTTFVTDENGNIIPLPDSVFGYDEFGNIIFIGNLTSLSTGVSFEDTAGQNLRNNLEFYTFNKFKNSQQPLIDLARQVFIDNQKVADPEDRFGNFQEIYLGYTIKIQEEIPLQSTSKTLLRRRGLALDSNEKIVTSTNLTFSDNLASIVDEVKYKLSRNLDQGLIGINTTDRGNNEITDGDALNVSGDLGANPIGINNEKASSNKRSSNNIAGQPITSINGTPINPNEPTKSRIGNNPFINEDVGDSSATVLSNTSAPNKNISLGSLINPITDRANEEDPELSAVRDIFSTIGSIDPIQISKILSKPGNENLTDEELVSSLKTSLLSTLDPNPDKVEEVKKKTQQWYDGLQSQTKMDWEQLFLQNQARKIPVPPFEIFYDNVEKEELPKWIKFLLRNRYTQTEVDYGISQDEIRDKYKIVIGDDGKVEIKLRPAFGNKN